jgi:hypothetical protein
MFVLHFKVSSRGIVLQHCVMYLRLFSINVHCHLVSCLEVGAGVPSSDILPPGKDPRYALGRILDGF